MRRRAGAVLFGNALVLFTVAMARAASVDIGTVSGERGENAVVAVSLRTMGATILGAQNRIGFDRTTPVAAKANGSPDCAVNAAINKNATGFRFQPLGCDPDTDCTAVRAIVLAFDNLDPIPDGAVLYTCTIAIAADAAVGTYLLRNGEVGASAAGGQNVPVTGTDGAVEVLDDSPDPVAVIDVGTAMGPPGGTATFEVTLLLLADPSAQVAGVRHDVSFDPLTPIAAASDGRPQCTATPGDISGSLSSFLFLPIDCTPGVDCVGMRALVLAPSSSGVFDDGATLYSCDIAIAAEAEAGSYPLVATMPEASDPLGEPLPATSSDGAVEVVELPPCGGDCDGDRVVVVNELLIAVNILLGSQPLTACVAIDEDESGAAAIHELVEAVSHLLSGCPT